MSLRWRLLLVGGATLLLAWLALANLFPEERRQQSALLPDDGMRLGLDLRGGIHWVLGPQLDVAVTEELEHLRGVLEGQLEEEGAAPARLVVEGQRLVVEPAGPVEPVREVLDEFEVLRTVDSNGALVLELTPEWRQASPSRWSPGRARTASWSRSRGSRRCPRAS